MSDIETEPKRSKPVIADDEEDDLFGDDDQQQQQQQQTTNNEEPTNDDDVDDLFGDEPEDSNNLNDFIERDEDDDDEPNDDQFLVNTESQTISRELKQQDYDIIRHPPKFRPSSESESDADIYDAKIPSYLTVQPSRFDANQFSTYVESLKDKTPQELELIKLQEENTVRWRFKRDADEGSLTMESNAQIVEWDDGSLSLKLGEELFDVIQSKVFDTYLATSTSNNEDNTEVYLADGKVSKLFKFVPTSTKSKIHKSFTSALIKNKQHRKATVQSVFVNIDPAREARQLEKLEEQKIRDRRKQQLRLEKEQELSSSNSSQRYARESSQSYNPRARLQDHYEKDDFLADDDEEDEGYGFDDDDEEDDDADEDDEDDAAAERLQRVKNEGAARYDDVDEEDHDGGVRKKRRVIDDDEDEE